eukprot:TRINITY_DN5_c0_g1_i1.p1 TRINITY_DN5_c0_g1~~TRINITY_DN5_c0_g1_i1.p1  ORF type:complete len:237 (-),score=65.64 TRINITY_DN5_c0_g1_i1:135-845(-)
MPKHNNVIPNVHFHKAWQTRVKTHFDQPGKKRSRRVKRAVKALHSFPRPVSGLLRPIVTAPTIRYNTKERLGRGFSLDELQGAGINKRLARSIGIAVDHRRANRSQERYRANVERLKKYKANLILYPRKAGKPKKGDSTQADIDAAKQLKGELQPIVSVTPSVQFGKIKEYKVSAFVRLRRARANAHLVGWRARRAEIAAEKAKNPIKAKAKPAAKPAAKGAAAKGAPAKGAATKK